MTDQNFQDRKKQHLRLAVDERFQARGLSGLDRVHLSHLALPEIDLNEVSLESIRFGSRVPTPFYVSGMTAGHPEAVRINRLIAASCRERGWAMGVGSQRGDLGRRANHAGVDQWKAFREENIELTLFGNIGLSQLISEGIEPVAQLVEILQANALVIHANPLQEALQPEGTPRFRGGIAALSALIETVDIPVVLKEVGCGFSVRMLEQIKDLRLAALDVAGLGGTHWGRIEGARAAEAEAAILSETADTFKNWGESTVFSLLAAKKVLPSVEHWASGGVRSGLDAAKLVAIGACQVGFAKPVLEQVLVGKEALEHWMKKIETEFRVALFCCGFANAVDLRDKEGVWSFQDQMP